jgi:hypothetical protein
MATMLASARDAIGTAVWNTDELALVLATAFAGSENMTVLVDELSRKANRDRT